MNEGGEFEDFDVLGAIGPVMAPANDDVATGKRVSVIAEIPTLKFKLEVHALPALRADLALGFAVREARLNGFDDVAEFFGDQSKEKHDALFVDRLVAKAAEVDGIAVGGAIFHSCRDAEALRRKLGVNRASLRCSRRSAPHSSG